MTDGQLNLLSLEKNNEITNFTVNSFLAKKYETLYKEILKKSKSIALLTH